MLLWHNKARTEPLTLVPDLEAMLLLFAGNDDKVYTVPGKTSIVTNEGKAAVNEAITFLKAATPIAALKWDQLLEFAAKDLAVAQGLTTETGHTAPANSDVGSSMSDRIAKYG